MKLCNTTILVKEILEKYPHTRDDDYSLWLRVLEVATARDNVPTFAHSVTLGAFLSVAKYSKYPHFETVGRVRRKLQEKYPDLRATKETENARAELEERFRGYAKENV